MVKNMTREQLESKYSEALELFIPWWDLDSTGIVEIVSDCSADKAVDTSVETILQKAAAAFFGSMRYTAERTRWGYEIRDNKNGLYLEGVFCGEYRWVCDYTYSKKYSEKTAKMHLLHLNGVEK